jgi:hypothetical protein
MLQELRAILSLSGYVMSLVFAVAFLMMVHQAFAAAF